METPQKAQYLRRRLTVRQTVRKIKRYSLVTAAVLTFAYASDHCNAREKIHYTAGKAKQGIEYVVEKLK